MLPTRSGTTYAGGVLVRLERRVGGVRAGSASFVYALTSLGQRVLDVDGARRRLSEPSAFFVDHTLAVAEFVVRLVVAARAGAFVLSEWQAEPGCWRDVTTLGGGLVLRPDLFIVLLAGEYELRWFVEIDRGTEHVPTLVRKCRLYHTYYKNGVEQREHERLPPRSLGRTVDQRRVNRLQRAIDSDRRLTAEIFRVTTEADALTVAEDQRVRLPRNRVLVGDARQALARMPAAYVDCVITSPPYFQLRDYGIDGQIGLEASVNQWVDELRLVARGLARVLRPTGSLWLNLGDTYARRESFGGPRKSLLLAPERLLLALAADGWIVRNKIVWAKTNPMPHSVTDRLSNSYEVIYFLTRQPNYFFNLDAIRVPHRSRAKGRPGASYPPPGVTPPLTRDPRGGNRGLVSLKATRDGRTPARSQPRRRLDTRLSELPRRPLRDLPARADRAPAAGRLSRTRRGA